MIKGTLFQLERVPFYGAKLICPADLLPLDQGIAGKRGAVQILPVHIHCRDLMVRVRRIVVNTFCRIPAGRIDRDLIFSIRDLAAATLLIDRAQNMEELSILQ